MTGHLPPTSYLLPPTSFGPSEDTTVVERRILAPSIVSVWLETKSVAARIQPGQFVQVRTNPGDEPFLRRPFSVAQQQRNRIRIVFRTVGRGTATLGQTRPGGNWNLLGPLGKPAPQFSNRDIVLVGGGIGIAPLLFLAERTHRNNRVHALLGARTRQEVTLRPEFRKLGVKLNLSTDDGSLGTKGLVTDTLQSVICNLQSAIAPVVFACGPRPMLRRVNELTKSLESYAFWEERMGCGTGICYGCAVKRANGEGYLRFCQEGPVLRMSDIEL
jgi:dihydroorotate dehydrogenase electron transfer subunit